MGLERLAVDYRKKSKIGFEIYPSPNISTSIVEPYNGLLSTHWLLDHTEVSLVLDNEAIYDICQKGLDIKKPGYENLNRLIAKVVSSMTSSFAPVVNKEKKDHDSNTVRDITDKSLQSGNFFVKYPDFDTVEDKYMAISLNYRGAVKSQETNSTVQWVKQQNKVSFV